MAVQGEIGWIGKNCPEHPAQTLICQAMRSGAGWFVGTYCEECRKEDPSPHSRESDYYQTRDDLLDAGFAGTIKWRDTQYRKRVLVSKSHAFLRFDNPDIVSGRYAVHCHTHGKVLLSDGEYLGQMSRPDNLWECPICRCPAQWDDEHYEAALDAEDLAAQGLGDGPSND